MVKKELIESIAEKFKIIGPVLNEKDCRVWAATEACTIGRGGPMIVAAATGLSRTTIYEGMKTKPANDLRLFFQEFVTRAGDVKV